MDNENQKKNRERMEEFSREKQADIEERVKLYNADKEKLNRQNEEKQENEDK